MDFDSKKRRDKEQDESDQSDQQRQYPAANLPRLLLPPHHPYQQQRQPSSARPLSAPESTTTELNPNLPRLHSTRTVTTAFSGIGGISCYFSVAQWEEFELQALIFRHAAVPSLLLRLPFNKSLIFQNEPSPPYSYYIPHPFPHCPDPRCQPRLLLSGYCGGSEPKRCKRSNGKWRCSKNVGHGHNYCECHLDSGRSNRSRKPVPILTPTPTPTPTPTTGVADLVNHNGGGGVSNKTSNNPPPNVNQPLTATRGGGGTTFALSVESVKV